MVTFIGHLGHEYQQQKFSYSNWAGLTLWASLKILKQQALRKKCDKRVLPLRTLVGLIFTRNNICSKYSISQTVDGIKICQQ